MSVLGGARQLHYGTTQIDYELVFTERKTLAIHVYPDTTVVVHAPVGSSDEMIAATLLRRARWIVQQQRAFSQKPPESPLPRQYVSGEAFRYLGHQLRLKVITAQVERVTLDGGFLQVAVRDPEDRTHIGDLVTRWYRRQAERIFAERLAVWRARAEAVGIHPPKTVSVRDMKTRWGTCSAGGRVTLNVWLVCVPIHLIDYVLLHELIHLLILNHSAAFFALLDRLMPDWRDRRDALNRAELR